MADGRWDLATRLSTGFEQYHEAVRSSWESARDAAAEVAERYAAEQLAAGQGDDTVERLGQVWLGYQQDMAKIHYEYGREVSERQRAWATVVGDVQAEAAAAAYEDYVESLRSLAAGVPGAEAAKRTPASGSRPRSSGRRKPEPKS
jgi:hypothetical protein